MYARRALEASGYLFILSESAALCKMIIPASLILARLAERALALERPRNIGVDLGGER